MKNVAMACKNRIICKGDMLFARLSLGSRVLAEGVITGVADMSDLLSRVRLGAPRIAALAHLQLRSISRGWSLERPMRLYPPEPSPYREAAFHVGPRFHWEV